MPTFVAVDSVTVQQSRSGQTKPVKFIDIGAPAEKGTYAMTNPCSADTAKQSRSIPAYLRVAVFEKGINAISADCECVICKKPLARCMNEAQRSSLAGKFMCGLQCCHGTAYGGTEQGPTIWDNLFPGDSDCNGDEGIRDIFGYGDEIGAVLSENANALRAQYFAWKSWWVKAGHVALVPAGEEFPKGARRVRGDTAAIISTEIVRGQWKVVERADDEMRVIS